MDEVRDRVWRGSLNVRVSVCPELLLTELSESQDTNLGFVNIIVPRDCYLALYLPNIIQKLESQLRISVSDYYSGWWFEIEGARMPWNFPVGALYDSSTGLNPSNRSSLHQENSVHVWHLMLRHGQHIPNGVIPLKNGIDQIREFWMHQWKQACYILNGSAKQVMSLSKPDTLTFWQSVIHRDLTKFEPIRQKIIPMPNAVRFIPLRIHVALPDVRLVEPICKAVDNERDVELGDVLAREFPEWFEANEESSNIAKPVIQGIEVPLSALVWEVYQQLSSFDGFLHISLCLQAENQTV
ncbi:LANO_0H15566g1_1 [Lachancea nothofagi CBS 11611]|uniref:Autophagy protein 5 n=1 Tax=Lachancea nothofagi CBS 11611 TaxID=1266666 RepID=A0A1G4KML2_9SACH|nr:LANO_0H15566g1_1 [Lachancea nothofagi CBS 11611]